MNELITVAKITAVFGLKGGVKLALETDIMQRFAAGNSLLALKDGQVKEYTVQRFMYSAKTPVLFLKGITSPEEAASLIKSSLCIPASDLHLYDSELEADVFHFSDLAKAKVYVDDLYFGEVNDIIEGGGGHLLEILKDGRSVLVPFVGNMVSTARLSEGRLDVTPPEGLFDEL